MATFITGACGFVGPALAEHLLARGETVVGYDLGTPPSAAQETFPTDDFLAWRRKQA